MTVATQHITPRFEPTTPVAFGNARANYAWWAHHFQLIADKEKDERHLFAWNPIQWQLDNIVNTRRNIFGGFQGIVLKARQMGMSTWITCRSDWRIETSENFRALHVAHDGDGTANMLDMIKLAHDGLPKKAAFKFGSVKIRPEEKAKNRNELRIRHDKEGIKESYAKIKTAGEKGKVGRSASPNLLHISEAGNEVFDDGEVFGASAQGLSKNAEVFVEGTADGAYGWFYELWQQAKNPDNPSNDWVPIFFPWFAMPAYHVPLVDGEVIEPRDEFEHKLMTGEITHEGYKVKPNQIKWMRWMMANRMPPSVEMTPLQWFQQEYANNDTDCFITSGNNYFVGEYVEKMMKHAKEYERTHKIKRYRLVGDGWVRDSYGPLRLTEEPIVNATYVIGGDAAKGLEHGDYDTAVVIKRVVDGPDEVVGYWRTHENDKGEHGRTMAELGLWFNKALLAIENNPWGHGNKVNDALDNLHYPRIYIQTMQDEGKFSKGIKKEYGFNTGGKTKSLYLGDLQDAMREWCKNPMGLDGIMVPFTAIVEELRTFQKKDGKTEAARGSYDDLVIALAIPTHLRTGVRATHRRNPKTLARREDEGIGYKEIVRMTGREDELDDYKGIFQP